MTGMRARQRRRCAWALLSPLMKTYHDREWGVPVREDRKLFEFLLLEGAQAGLSWETVLKKRENYRKAFNGFDPRRVARYSRKEVRRLLADRGIIRNRAKIHGAITNARCVLEVQKECGSFARYIWQFVDGQPIRHGFRRLRELPATTPESDRMSRDLRERGFKFAGPTICYAFMQAVGMANDHTTGCFRYRQLR